MKVLRFRRIDDQYVIRVHIDQQRRLASSHPLVRRGQAVVDDPDPEWIVEWRWGVEHPDGFTPDEWRRKILEETVALAGERLRQMRTADGGEAMPEEGMIFPTNGGR